MTEAAISAPARPKIGALAAVARNDAMRAFELFRSTFIGAFVFIAGFSVLSSALEGIVDIAGWSRTWPIVLGIATARFCIAVLILAVTAHLALIVHRLILVEETSPTDRVGHTFCTRLCPLVRSDRGRNGLDYCTL